MYGAESGGGYCTVKAARIRTWCRAHAEGSLHAALAGESPKTISRTRNEQAVVDNV